MGNPFKRTNGARMGSTVQTVQNQGGGDKKAGLVPTMNLTEAKNIAYNVRHLPQSAAVMKINLYKNVKPSRPIYIRPTNYKP
jgi:hypothetical protein